jgi:isopentenyl phosphate kinase
MRKRLVLLKLGGSLITDKNQPHTPRLDVMQRLAGEIATAMKEQVDLQVVLGHGAGSFGHVPASRFKTRQGVKTPGQWKGFVEVWREAIGLNHIVRQALEEAGLPAIVFPPSAAVLSSNGKVVSWNLYPLQHALDQHLLPLVYGDVVFDSQIGGTILSTEDLFAFLVAKLQPDQVLLAGNEPGVWEDFPDNSRLLSEITPASFTQIGSGLGGSTATDVTGGMAEKVRQVIAMLEAAPGMHASIFSGQVPGNVYKALRGEAVGTQVHT